MMEIFRFIKWQWNRYDSEGKALAILCLLESVWIIYGLYLGIFFLLVLLYSVLGAVVYMFGCLVVDKIHSQWRKYKKQVKEEEDRMVDILRGKSK